MNVLAVADAPGILEHYYHEGKGSDPVVHFYETFLMKYNPEETQRRGVRYTPEPVVGYIVHSLHKILKSFFGMQDGLASNGVILLDLAADTMTFVAQATEQAIEEFVQKYGTGGREDFIRKHILRNFYAFELIMAPYAIGHLKIGFLLEEPGYRLSDEKRMPFYLTNTLDNEERDQFPLLGHVAALNSLHRAHSIRHRANQEQIKGKGPGDHLCHRPDQPHRAAAVLATSGIIGDNEVTTDCISGENNERSYAGRHKKREYRVAHALSLSACRTRDFAKSGTRCFA